MFPELGTRGLAGAPDVEILFIASQIRLTVDLETVARGPRASAKDASTSLADNGRTCPSPSGFQDSVCLERNVLTM
jgi:hypothetical protein